MAIFAQLCGAYFVAGSGGFAVSEEIVSRYTANFPASPSKKGLQVEDVEDALSLGVKHAAINVNLAQLIAPSAQAEAHPSEMTWRYGGRDYRFQPSYVQHLDGMIAPLSKQGVVVYLILLVYQAPDGMADSAEINRCLLHPNFDQEAPNRLSAFNVETSEGRDWLVAAVEFMAERWSRPEPSTGRVAGYIVGNEVNSHWWWSNQGRATAEGCIDDYAQAVRLVWQAVRRQASWGRVYISLEHHWGIRYPAGRTDQAIPGKEFVDRFAQTVRASGDFDWHLAYHPYPENLFEPRFWLDRSATSAVDTPRITFKNLDVLCNYFQRPELQVAGQSRRIILSEQGFHTPDGAVEGISGEAIQAAAFCYAYRLVENQPSIDAFILHRHVDHPAEGGLNLGLRRYTAESSVRPAKQIYGCFQAADTPAWPSVFEFALPVVGLKQWPERGPLR